MMEREGFFGYADEPWLPTLLDIERMKAEGTDEEKAYWQKFGWEVLDVPEADTHVKARMDILKTRFIANYGWRMLAYETMEQWQVRLQEKFDSVVDRYERAYQLYEDNRDDMMKDAVPGITTTVSSRTTAGGSDKTSNTGSVTDNDSGSDSTTATSKHSDTPDSMINTSDNYAGTIDKDTSSITYGKKSTKTIGTDATTNYGRMDSVEGTTKEIYTGGRIMESINNTIDAWMDIDTAFIHSFENLFSNILWS